MGAANSTRKLTVDTMALLAMLEPNAQERERKMQLCARVETTLQQRWPSMRVLPFGSSASHLDFGGSDLDLGIFYDDIDMDALEHLTADERVAILRDAWLQLMPAKLELVELVEHARVPVLKLLDAATGVACDICVGSAHVLMNTALLKYCGDLDPRVRPLALTVKYWAKERGINDAVNGTLSSYGYVLLVLFYLQASRHLLPPASAIFGAVRPSTTISSLLKQLESLPRLDITSTFGSTDTDSIGALLYGFFRFYAVGFDLDQEVVSVRNGSALAKEGRWPHSVHWRISIEDPFEGTHDVGRVVFSQLGQHLISREFHRAYEMLLTGCRLTEVCAKDSTAWNYLSTCYLCGSTEHKARQCDSVGIGPCNHDMMECWYCGAIGHIKATCPLHEYLNLPSGDRNVMLKGPTPVVVPKSPVHTSSISNNLALAPRASPKRKKKKRPRFGSISSLASSPEQDRSRKYMVAARRLHAKRRIVSLTSSSNSNPAE